MRKRAYARYVGARGPRACDIRKSRLTYVAGTAGGGKRGNTRTSRSRTSVGGSRNARWRRGGSARASVVRAVVEISSAGD